MVKVNGVPFGIEQYKNGETIFRAVEKLGNCSRIKINTKFENYADIFKTCIAFKYANEYLKPKHIDINMVNFFMVDKLNALDTLLYLCGVDSSTITVKKGYNASYVKESVTETSNLEFTGDNSIGKWLLNMAEKPCSEFNMFYIPYARMDRVVADKIFAFKYFAAIINDVKHNNAVVNIFDPHNNTCSLIKNIQNISLIDILGKVVDEYKPDIICYPDGGAYYKYNDIFEIFDIPAVYAIKQRNDVNHEEIIRYELNTDDVDIINKRVLIIDDICSTGSTLIKAANILTSKGAEDIAVYVSHCERSMFNGPMLASGMISHIFTTNSLKRDRECQMITTYDI